VATAAQQPQYPCPLSDDYALCEISAADTDGMSELLDESQRDEADFLLEYCRQIAGLRAKLGEQDERHWREMGDRTAKVEAARSLVGKNSFTAQMNARAEKAAALKDMESKSREVLLSTPAAERGELAPQGLGHWHALP
jgi:hypothetical protein